MRLLITVAVLFFIVVEAKDYKKICITKLKSYFNQQLMSDAQLSSLTDVASKLASSGDAGMDNLQADMMEAATKDMTASQMFQAYTLLNQAKSLYGDDIGKLMTAAKGCINNAKTLVKPLFDEIMANLKKATANKKSIASRQAMIYKYIADKSKDKFIKKVAVACKNGMSADDWNKFRQIANGLINIDMLVPAKSG